MKIDNLLEAPTYYGNIEGFRDFDSRAYPANPNVPDVYFRMIKASEHPKPNYGTPLYTQEQVLRMLEKAHKGPISLLKTTIAEWVKHKEIVACAVSSNDNLVS